MGKNKEKRKPVDWEAIEPDWVAGIKSKLQLSEEYGVSRAGLNKHFAELGIERDETAKIRAKAEALVTQDAVTPKVTGETKAADRERIDANAEMMANVIRGHRTDASRLRRVVTALLAKVEAIVKESELFEQIGDLCLSPDDKGMDKINDLYRKVIELPSQTDTTKKLAETMKILIELERKIFKIESGDDPIEAAARGAAQGAAQGTSEGSKSILAGLIAELNNAEADA